MGQYHYIVNLDKREFIDACQLGTGVKAWEQIANHPGSPQALFVLLICSNGRGGGDLRTPETIGCPVVGRWAGDRIAVVGDYAQDSDIKPPPHDQVSSIYDLCVAGTYRDVTELVRPVLAAELGVEYYTEQRIFRLGGGKEERYEIWRFRRDPAAAFSVLGE